jgi:hypothetical protein
MWTFRVRHSDDRRRAEVSRRSIAQAKLFACIRKAKLLLLWRSLRFVRTEGEGTSCVASISEGQKRSHFRRGGGGRGVEPAWS